jgi:hypothetical protein
VLDIFFTFVVVIGAISKLQMKGYLMEF